MFVFTIKRVSFVGADLGDVCLQPRMFSIYHQNRTIKNILSFLQVLPIGEPICKNYQLTTSSPRRRHLSLLKYKSSEHHPNIIDSKREMLLHHL